MYTTATAILEALAEAGVDYIFANFGSDHPALIEALGEARAAGRSVPEVIICPNEMVGMSSAHGYWQASGKPQAVLVHVECGTQALGGAMHNAAKGRAPMLILAGASPYTQEGELKGSRNEFIQWIQDVHDQRGIVRGYVKYDAEIRTGANAKQMVHRALQMACSNPQGPVYLMAAREVLEEETKPVLIRKEHWQPLAPAALAPHDVRAIGEALLGARRPLIVTSYLGRSSDAVGQLVALCESLGVGVLESVPSWMNFPHDNPLYQTNQWNGCGHGALETADLILVLDSDVPWIPTVSRPSRDALIFHVDVDPLKEQMPLWYIPSVRSFAADVATALRQLNAWVAEQDLNEARIEERRLFYFEQNKARRGALDQAAAAPADGSISAEFFLSSLRRHSDETMLFLNESISNYSTAFDHLAPAVPGCMFASGGGSLGWNGGAAIGVKLAQPNKTVVALTGDGSYMFSQPSTVHWMARRYETPFLQVILNNGGWKSPRLSTVGVHPEGHMANGSGIDMSFDPAPHYTEVAVAAGGAWGRRIACAGEVEVALTEALRVVRQEKRCAVLDVMLRS